jgi:tetratricopeptide (TPR) repeat protein
MTIISLLLRLIQTVCLMFFVGEPFPKIKLACLIDCANYFHKKGSIEKAIKYYKAGLEINPEDYYGNIGLAGALAVDKSFPQSLPFFKKAISIKEPDLLGLFLMYIAYDASGETDFAEGIFKKLVTLFDNDAIAVYERLSYTYFELDMFKKAESYINKVLDTYPNKPASHFNLANILLARGDFDKSRCEFQKVLELASDERDQKFIKLAKKELKKIESRNVNK